MLTLTTGISTGTSPVELELRTTGFEAEVGGRGTAAATVEVGTVGESLTKDIRPL